MGRAHLRYPTWLTDLTALIVPIGLKLHAANVVLVTRLAVSLEKTAKEHGKATRRDYQPEAKISATLHEKLTIIEGEDDGRNKLDE